MNSDEMVPIKQPIIKVIKGHVFQEVMVERRSGLGNKLRSICLNEGCKRAKKANTYLENGVVAAISPCKFARSELALPPEPLSPVVIKELSQQHTYQFS